MNQLFLFLVLGTFGYLLDILTSNKRYTKCKDITTQSLLWLHHVMFVFSLTGWLSTSKPLLVLYLLVTVITAVHWHYNNDVCAWTTTVNERCGVKGGLRSVFRLAIPNTDHIPFRTMQRIWYSIGAVVAIYKLIK